MIFTAKIVQHRDLLLNLVKRELKGRYKDSVLGFLWSILNPLFLAIIYMFFLRLLVGRGVPTEDVIIGVFAWQFTAQSISGGMSCITGNATLIKKVYFPRVILPLSVIAGNLINYVLTIFVQLFLLIFVLAWKGSMLGIGLFAMPLVVLYQTLFILGMVLVVSSANVYFRDIQHLVNLLLTAWFFMTPAIYNLTFIQPILEQFPFLGNLYFLNPMASIITMYRALLLPESVFFWSWGVVLGLVWPIIFLYFAYRIFQSAQRNFADYV
ncbi:ABC transporter permease [Desulfonatronum lacustre]|uniref:ABC transporter permease n=1 Tax=Desulfonatronum lacustre TaxID=66849 RepID=UPI00048E6129|nr:ABC transporter permease [Desulfonatronum lacustre]SMP38406.1 ABC-2 type transport system permease protein/lipopolysaccharide transport system permease protein [Desulfonatronum zhilinae]